MKKFQWSKKASFLCTLLLLCISIPLLVVSAIYFSKLSFDPTSVTNYWIKYLWLCLMIISSITFITCVLIMMNTFYKITRLRKIKRK